MPEPAVTVVVLAGGEATRLPGKLFLAAGDVPMLVRVYRNVAPGRPVVLSCKEALPPDISRAIDAPVTLDEWPLLGPLGGVLSALQAVRTPWFFAVAGDAPFIDAAFIDGLERLIEPGDEAIVPRHRCDGRDQLEPLAALYARDAFSREGLPELRSGRGALRMVIDRLRARIVPVESETAFANVNTPQDYAAFRREFA